MAPLSHFQRPSGSSGKDYILVHDSDSEPEFVEKAKKRQTTALGHRNANTSENDDVMDVDIEVVYPNLNDIRQQTPVNDVDLNKNAHLKGRRRFMADLEDLKGDKSTRLVGLGFRAENIQAGDDEGTIELTIRNGQGEYVLSINLLISDTSDYPKNHSFFGYSPDSNLSKELSQAVENIASWPSHTIRQTILKLLSSLSPCNAGSYGYDESQSQEVEMEDEGSDDDYDAYDIEDFGVGIESTMNMTKFYPQRLQHDFIETIASNYRPGFLRFGGDDFAISVSLPVIILADSIPPRALMAWDRRFLSRTQHLTLLISGFRGCYPLISGDGSYSATAHNFGATLTFKVGLTGKYKPGKEIAREAGRTFGLVTKDAEDELRIQAQKEAVLDALDYDFDGEYLEESTPIPVPSPEEEDEGRFDGFSLSSSLEGLLDLAFLKVVQIRRRFGLGWSGAEILLSEVEKSQLTPEIVYDKMEKDILEADKEESRLARTNNLPHDPLTGLNVGDVINLPLTAFSYLVRRLSLCTRYCIVCHNKLTNDYEALKPYVCESKLCAYQYYLLNQGPSLEYEIVYNPQTVDLLVSLAHSAALEGVMDEPLPIGLGLRVRPPDSSKIPGPPNPFPGLPYAALAPTAPELLPNVTKPLITGADGLCDFDDLDLQQMRASIVELIDTLPSIDDMKRHLEWKVKPGKSRPKLRELGKDILPAAWSILRWCVASCTAHLQEITSGKESIKGVDPNWRQFRFSTGAPDAEAKFKTAVQESQAKSANAKVYPSLYAFHGSPTRNWHSIIRHGLWYKSIAHGRAFGNGVYLAKDASVSMGHYAQTSICRWKGSRISPTNCVALAEIVNLPTEFVSHSPYFVIQDTHWIMCRYLLVKGGNYDLLNNPTPTEPSSTEGTDAPLVKLDPAHPVTLSSAKIQIPDPSHQINILLQTRKEEFCEDDSDDDDLFIFAYQPGITEINDSSDHLKYDRADFGDDGNYRAPTPVPEEPPMGKGKGKVAARDAPLRNDWKHDAEWVSSAVEELMPPPVEASPGATMAVQRELRATLQEQESARTLKELGWYMPPELIGDNLFQWIVEMHSFDEVLPIAADLKARNINSIIFEIRFPPSYPLAPPFFRIVTPRFLPFIQGGGGHVTAGGSICMDLLTTDGWLPSYSIPAVLMQIKLAISNLDPRPARLAPDPLRPYEVHEALTGYKRAAATHGWQVPVGIDRLVR